MPEPAKIRNVAVVGHRGTGKTSLVVTVSAVMGVETIGRMKGLSPRATPHRDGKVTHPPLYDLPPHTAQMTWIFPPPTTRMMTWPP